MAKKPVVIEADLVPPVQQAPALEHDYSRSGMVNPLYTLAPEDFTGVTRSMICIDNFGNRNFNVLTIYIEKGQVVKIDLSDPYVVWEAISKMNHWSELAGLNLNSNWAIGKTLTK